MKVIFIGGLTDGKVVFDYLKSNKYVSELLTFTYPDNYAKPRAVNFAEGHNIIKTESLRDYQDMICSYGADYIFVAGWSELISEDVIRSSSGGVFGFHPSRLPYDRGRSVLAWQIEEGYRETALTMFQYADYPDGGDIIAQEKIAIEENDYIDDILDKVDKATYNIMRAYFQLIRQGKVVARSQDLSEGNFRRLRDNGDSVVSWDANTATIYNKIRAISRPYPGAVATIEGKDYKVWRAEPLHDFPYGGDLSSGELVANVYSEGLVVKTRDSFLLITDYEEL